jgi:hypothetical protein
MKFLDNQILELSKRILLKIASDNLNTNKLINKLLKEKKNFK